MISSQQEYNLYISIISKQKITDYHRITVEELVKQKR